MLYYKKNVLDNELLKELVLAAKRNFDPHSNYLSLDDAPETIEKVSEKIKRLVPEDVLYLKSHIFISSITTPPSWHIDLTTSDIVGNCYNVWIPLFVEDKECGMEIILKEKNLDLYTQLGDPKEQFELLYREKVPMIFDFLDIRPEFDIVFLKRKIGLILPYKKKNLISNKFSDAEINDLSIFMHDDIHKGISTSGMRIQLQMKYVSTDATLNREASNDLYLIFQTVVPSPNDLFSFTKFQKQVA